MERNDGPDKDERRERKTKRRPGETGEGDEHLRHAGQGEASLREHGPDGGEDQEPRGEVPPGGAGRAPQRLTEDDAKRRTTTERGTRPGEDPAVFVEERRAMRAGLACVEVGVAVSAPKIAGGPGDDAEAHVAPGLHTP